VNLREFERNQLILDELRPEIEKQDSLVFWVRGGEMSHQGTKRDSTLRLQCAKNHPSTLTLGALRYGR